MLRAGDRGRTGDLVRTSSRVRENWRAFAFRVGQRPASTVISTLSSRPLIAAIPLPDVPPIHLFYVLIGSIGMIFSQAPECERLMDEHPTAAETIVATHAKTVIALLLE